MTVSRAPDGRINDACHTPNEMDGTGRRVPIGVAGIKPSVPPSVIRLTLIPVLSESRSDKCDRHQRERGFTDANSFIGFKGMLFVYGEDILKKKKKAKTPATSLKSQLAPPCGSLHLICPAWRTRGRDKTTWLKATTAPPKASFDYRRKSVRSTTWSPSAHTNGCRSIKGHNIHPN